MKFFNRKTNIQELIKKYDGELKLNVGCGTDYKNGWINIDNNTDNNIDKLDINWDLRNPLPFEDNSVYFIFNEHFIEHLTVEEARKSLKDLKRVLKAGGVMRIAMPDLELAVEIYQDPNWKQRPVIKNFGMDYIETRAELLNMGFRFWDHKWFYDWEELDRRLKEVGFEDITRCKLGKSKYKGLQGLETREESMLIAEATK